MSIEFAFILGVLFGQWLILIAIWRALHSLVKLLTSTIENNGQQPTPSTAKEIIYVPRDEGTGKYQFLAVVLLWRRNERIFSPDPSRDA